MLAFVFLALALGLTAVFVLGVMLMIHEMRQGPPATRNFKRASESPKHAVRPASPPSPSKSRSQQPVAKA
jgi:hypothetical protein